MPDWLHAWLQLYQDSAIGVMVRNAGYLYPVLESSHILGISLLVGPAFAFDLRVFGLGRSILPVTTAARHLLPVSHVGFAIALSTGFLLLGAQATVVASSRAAPWKLGLLLLACLNVLVFHCGIYRHVHAWAQAPVAPMAARVGAGISMLAWSGVIFAGRFLAYM